MKTIHRLSLVTTIATCLLISIGGFVRAAGAGLGCPDWPRCLGRWIPPTDASQLPADMDGELFNFAKAWIEYMNRLFGVLVGLLILATFLVVLRKARHRPEILWPVSMTLLLVIFQGWFGGQVVKHELDPRFVSVHLVVALVMLMFLLTATYRAGQETAVSTGEMTPGAVRLDRWLSASLALTVLQVLLGAWVRGSVEELAPDIPDRAEWLEGVGVLFWIHRSVSIPVALVIAWSCRQGRGLGGPIRRWAGITLLILLGQLLVGIWASYGALPPATQVLHVTLGSWLLGSLFLLRLMNRSTAA